MSLMPQLTLLSVIVGTITGAVAGARHGPEGILLGGAWGLLSGAATVAASLSPLALSEDTPRTIWRAWTELSSVLMLLGPILSGCLAWWWVRHVAE